MYYEGKGVEPNDAEALRYARLAAEQGVAPARHMLGVMYYEGRAVRRDFAESARWYRLAAEQGYGESQNNLGLMYYEGQGVAQDYYQAAQWLMLAADNDVPQSQYTLGWMYYKGLGVAKDPDQAAEWFRRAAMENINKIRNIGISAHIDSGKTTLSERILFYAGRIHRMQEVRGEGTAATMDFMELEKERGITITSAATQVTWKDRVINLIDTPGHVDFTVEVERSLRVLDGAVMVLCSVGGVQSQSFTVDQQMKRYRVPRIAFINKMDRTGADPERVCRDMREKLGLNVVPMQFNMGEGEHFAGVIDLVTMEAVTFEGDSGEDVIRGPIPAEYKDMAETTRHEMLEALSMFNDELMELLLEEKPIDLSHDPANDPRSDDQPRHRAGDDGHGGPQQGRSACNGRGLRLPAQPAGPVQLCPRPQQRRHRGPAGRRPGRPAGGDGLQDHRRNLRPAQLYPRLPGHDPQGPALPQRPHR
jgi:small GTP-binding protein